MKIKHTLNMIVSAAFGLLSLSLVSRVRATCEQGCGAFNSTFLGENALASGNANQECTAVGTDALMLNANGDNTAVGAFALSSDVGGGGNSAVGEDALLSNTSGDDNTATGAGALQNNKTADNNTATGSGALFTNTTGTNNVAVGASALSTNDSGNDNVAIGATALYSNTANENTAIGYQALFSNSVGTDNVASGDNALYSNTNGNFNAAHGVGALKANADGNNNAAEGYRALYSNQSGNNNTAMGFKALLINTGSNNIAIGASAGSNLTTGSNNIDIGGLGAMGEANTIRLGKKGTQTDTYIAGISGNTVAGGVGVIIDTNGHMGTMLSSARYKENIEPMGKSSEAILALQPVTFSYKRELDPKAIPQFGLVAEQVEKVNPDLVAYDEKGKPYSVRYEAVNAMLLNEFLKAHRELEAQKATIASQQKAIAALTQAFQEQSAQIQKIGGQVAGTAFAIQIANKQ